MAAWLAPYAALIRLDKPIGWLLLLWPTLTALWIAADHNGQAVPDFSLLLIFPLGVFIMRSAGCCINDFADAKFDGYVERTRNRPLVSGALKRWQALACFLLLAGIAFLLVQFTNRFTMLLSFGAVAVAATYPLMKRITHLAQVVLGVAFSWGILMAFSAQTNALPPIVWLLFIANVLWTVAYDTQYAMVDRNYDEELSLKSTAILFGTLDRLIILALQTLFLLALLLAGWQLELGLIFQIALLLAALLFLYQQFLIRDRLPDPCLRAFQNNNYVGLIIFLGTVLSHSPLPTLLGL